VVLHVGEDVRVGVEGDGYGGVPKHLGDVLWVDVAAQQKGRAGVPEVVEPDGREGSLLEERCEGSVSEVRRV
jgi:hypothetical protein